MPHADFHYIQTVEKFRLATLKTASKHGFLSLAKDRGAIF
jgi:hypothetical protein